MQLADMCVSEFSMTISSESAVTLRLVFIAYISCAMSRGETRSGRRRRGSDGDRDGLVVGESPPPYPGAKEPPSFPQ